MTIHSLRPRIAYQSAVSTLAPAGARGVLQRWTKGKPLVVTDIYVPYRLYRIVIEDRGRQSSRYWAVDATAGTLDPYEFACPPPQEDFVEIETRNFLPAGLVQSEAATLAIGKIRRLIFSTGFFRLVRPVITAELVQPEFFVPYWVAFYGNEQNMTLTVLNAVRLTIEGGKVRQLIRTWLQDGSANSLMAQSATPRVPS
ncbi:MAG TPA: hypothetical protein VN176_01110 [Verrucomicrobiae bacterium]|jgi:hypothetical protein|nr:hypothetical protein [Verrucomicrobiae bacterium]